MIKIIRKLSIKKSKRIVINGCLLLSSLYMNGSISAPAVAMSQSAVGSGIQEVLRQADFAVKSKDYNQASRILQSSINSIKTADTSNEARLQLIHRLSFVSRLKGEHYRAIDQLNEAAKISRSLTGDSLLPVLLYDLGTSYLTVGEPDRAITVLTESSNLFQKPYKNSLPLRVQINLSHALIEKKQSQGMQMRLKELGDNIGQLNDSKQRAELMLSLGRLYQLAQKELKLGSDFRSQAYDWFTKTAELAKGLQDPVLNTYLDGFTGQLYEDEARYDEAMIFTRRAVVSAQGAQSDEALFKWEWQLARLLNNKGDGSAALNSYRQAISTLQRVRLSLLMGARSNFKRYIEPVYYQYFDLLLKQARAQQSSKQIYKLLRETVDALENYRVSEVEDYFQSACVESDTNNSVNNIDPSTAVIYPVILDDRVELIVAINNRLTLYTKTISRTQVTNTLRSFREKLENPRLQSGYLQDAQALYGWLVEPFVEDAKKEKIQNLMYVPDGPLRSIPMAALHDGNNYLIEKFSTVTTPSLALTKLGKPEPFIAKMLASGVTKAVQGYDALPSVGYELSNVSRSRSTVTLKDEDFVLSRAEKELSEGGYSIVHMATHGEFSSDYRNSYLLTYDNKLTMSKLEKTIGVRQFTDKPLDLLVLSACQTAVGDDRAALGLAGIAIKAGARSAIATLWFINDEATSRLMSELYKQLGDPNVNKAQALQGAQLSLINSRGRNHPYYWSPFILIGNWL